MPIVPDSETFVVNAGTQVSVSVGADTTILEGESVAVSGIVSGSSAGSYAWNPSTQVACATCSATECIHQLATTLYQLVYEDSASLCLASDDILISVTPLVPRCIFPDAFTPNNDAVLITIIHFICDDVSKNSV
jgi:hypothetical protein